MYSRAASKLHLTNTVIEEGRFSLLDQAQAAAAGLQVGELEPAAEPSSEAPCDGLRSPPQLSEILKFGVDKLLSSDESSVQEVELEKILGASRGGQWVEDEVPSSLMEEPEEEENPSDADGQSGFEISVMFSHRGAKRPVVTLMPYVPPDHMYCFEGKDYSKDPSADDQKSFERLMEEQLDEFKKAATEGRAMRLKAGVRRRRR